MSAWQDRAICAEHPNPGLWSPVAADPKPDVIAEPIRICGNCPAKDECLSWALDPENGIEEGIWGGVVVQTLRRDEPWRFPTNDKGALERVARIKAMWEAGLGVFEIAAQVGMATSTVERRIQTIRADSAIAKGQQPPGPRRRPTAKCGTPAGYKRHRRLGQGACAPCKAAQAEAGRIRYGAAERIPPPCGTEAAYKRHRRAGEEPCQECRDAQAAANRRRSTARPETDRVAS